MNVKDIITNIKTLLSVKLAAYKAEDGTILEIKELVVGEILYVVDTDGSNPVSAGDYILEDGTVLTCDDAGIVTEIKLPEPSTGPDAPAEGEESKQILEQLTALKGEFDALKLEHEDIIKTLQILSESLSDKLFKQEIKTTLKKEVVKEVDNVVISEEPKRRLPKPMADDAVLKILKFVSDKKGQ